MPDSPRHPRREAGSRQLFSAEDRRAFGLGAWAGVCVAVAAAAALAVLLLTTPSESQLDNQAWTPTSTLYPAIN